MFIGTGNVNLSRGTLTRGAVSRGGASFGAPVSQNSGRGGFASSGQQSSIFDNPTNSFSRGAPSRGGLSRGAYRGDFSRGMSNETSFSNPPSRGNFSRGASREMSNETSFNNNPCSQTRGDSFSARGGSTSRGQDNTRGDFRRGSFGGGFNAPALDQSNGFKNVNAGSIFGSAEKQDVIKFYEEKPQVSVRSTDNLVKEDKKAINVEKAVVPSASTKPELAKDKSALKAPVKKAEEPVASLQKNNERKPEAAPISTPANQNTTVVAPQNVGPEFAAVLLGLKNVMEALRLSIAQIDAAVTVPSSSVADEKVAEPNENRVEEVAPAAVKEANTADPSVGSKKSSGSHSDKKAHPNKEHRKKSRSTGTKDAGIEKKKAATPAPPVSPEDYDEDGW
uniref:Uncharacterized protein n=2 Tax=Panagrolaimus sp. PS1159 TaxID=55785 RepID=A0AC35GIT2_9BILA